MSSNRWIPFLAAILLFSRFLLLADTGKLEMRVDGATLQVQVQGSTKDDWHLETSADLLTWTTQTNFGQLISGAAANAPWRAVAPAGTVQYYRARQTRGLYDPGLFRTIDIVFPFSNWDSKLRLSRTAQTNTECGVFINNGATNGGVGARYKGNTSYTQSLTKKSINLEFDFVTEDANVMGYETVNLNNAHGDETIMREPLYFYVMGQYTPCPKAGMAQVNINGAFWGVYSLVQQENGQLLKEWFPSNDGDRWATPNSPIGGGGFVSSNSAFHYFGNTNIASYTQHYIIKSENSPTNDAYARLIDMIRVLNTTPAENLRNTLENVLAVDRWLWFLAIENVFTDDDSYWNKGADYAFYWEKESGRIHPVQHDGNEAFTVGDTTLSPVIGATGNNRPLLYRMLAIPELRQRYLAHMRTVLEENFNPTSLTPVINQFHTLSIAAITTDPNRGYTMASYTNDLVALKTHITNRYNFLIAHAELTPARPAIMAVNGPTGQVLAADTPFVTASVTSAGGSGVDSVWLYFRGQAYGKFAAVQMLDDGVHGDGAAGDGVFGAAVAAYPAASKVSYYVEARASNAAKAARFSPARAEQAAYSYRVTVATASSSPVIINEIAADNTLITDPQGELEDWVELRNISDEPVDLTGKYLSDDSANPRKWQFPVGTIIPANGYLVVWADEDVNDTPGLHAYFKLSKGGERVVLSDTDVNGNATLDLVIFGAQTTNKTYGRTAANPDVLQIMNPTQGTTNP